MKKINIKNKKVLLFSFIIMSLLILLITKNADKKVQPEYKITNEDKNKKTFENGESNPPKENIFKSTTSPNTNTQPAEKIAEDVEFAKYWEGIIREYPWFRKLPIEKERYRILYVIEEKSFRIRLKISENSPKEQKQTIINQALKDIDEVTGVSHENFPYYVLYTEN